MALYNDTGSNLVKFNFNQNPLAKELTPTKKDLDMAVWGLPEMDGMDNYDLDPEKDIDMETMQGEEYFKTLQNLTQLHSSAKAKNINISNPGKDPNAQQFSKEWLSAYYENIQRGKELKQSLDNRETYAKYVNSPNTVAIPLPKGEIVTSDIVNNSLYRYDDAPLKSIVGAYKQREYIYGVNDLDKLSEEYDNAQQSILGWLVAQPQQFREQLRLSVVEPYLNAIKSPQIDQYKIDKLEFDKQKQAEIMGIKREQLKINWNNANTSAGRLKLSKQLAESEDVDNGYNLLFADLLSDDPKIKQMAQTRVSQLPFAVNQKSPTTGKVETTYVTPSKIVPLSNGSYDVYINNKKLYTITPDENGYIGGLKTAYDERIKQKQTGYKPVDIPNVVPQTKPTVAPKPTTVAPKPTIAPKPNQVQKKVEKTTTTPDWGFK